MDHRVLLIVAVSLAASAQPLPPNPCGRMGGAECRLHALTLQDRAAAFKLLDGACFLNDAIACQRQAVWLYGEALFGTEDWVNALPRAEKACRLGNVLGCYALAEILSLGKGVTLDRPRGLKLFLQACEGNVGIGCAQAASMGKEDGTLDAGRQHELLIRACSLDSAHGCLRLGDSRRDTSEGREAWAKACRLGEAEGCRKSGAELYAKGATREARAAFETACKAKDVVSCRGLGLLDLQEARPDLAVARFRDGCEQGHQWSCISLGIQQLKGEGVPYSPSEAARLFDAACEQGTAWGCGVRGWLYRELEKDPVAGRARAIRACELQDAECNWLGDFEANGWGGPRDDEKATRTYERACEGGNTLSCTNAGWRLLRGQGVKGAAVRGAELSSKACSKGEPIGCSNFNFAKAMGLGIPRDAESGLSGLKQDCEKLPATCENLGLFYDEGAPRQPARALEAFSKACRAGNNDACQAAQRVAKAARLKAPPPPEKPAPSPRTGATAGQVPLPALNIPLPSLRGGLGF